MDAQTQRVIRKVLFDAGKTPHFFDLNDAQRMNWMIARAYEIGKEQMSRIYRQTSARLQAKVHVN